MNRTYEAHGTGRCPCLLCISTCLWIFTATPRNLEMTRIRPSLAVALINKTHHIRRACSRCLCYFLRLLGVASSCLDEPHGRFENASHVTTRIWGYSWKESLASLSREVRLFDFSFRRVLEGEKWNYAWESGRNDEQCTANLETNMFVISKNYHTCDLDPTHRRAWMTRLWEDQHRPRWTTEGRRTSKMAVSRQPAGRGLTRISCMSCCIASGHISIWKHSRRTSSTMWPLASKSI